jgi:2'-phosphotransferase
MRGSSQVLIFINLEKALSAGIKFYISSNGVVLTPGDDSGFLSPQFFKRVEQVRVQKTPLLLEILQDDSKSLPKPEPTQLDTPVGPALKTSGEEPPSNTP